MIQKKKCCFYKSKYNNYYKLIDSRKVKNREYKLLVN